MNDDRRKIWRKISLLLPSLTGEQAYWIAETIDGIALAIWCKYGDAMADYQGRVHPDMPPSKEAKPVCDNPGGGDVSF